jgi:hypothetical protein
MIEPMLTDLAEVRPLSVAEQLAARVPGHAHCSVLLCTLHIGGANLKSRATRDSPVLPRSFTDVPAPSGQRRCRIHPKHCCKLHTEAIRGLQPRSDRNDCDGDPRTRHRRRRSRRKSAAACGMRASRMHSIRNMRLAGSPAVANRPAEAVLCLEVACEHPDVRLPSQYAGVGGNVLRTQQAHTNSTRPMPGSYGMSATC